MLYTSASIYIYKMHSRLGREKIQKLYFYSSSIFDDEFGMWKNPCNNLYKFVWWSFRRNSFDDHQKPECNATAWISNEFSFNLRFVCVWSFLFLLSFRQFFQPKRIDLILTNPNIHLDCRRECIKNLTQLKKILCHLIPALDDDMCMAFFHLLLDLLKSKHPNKCKKKTYE